MLVDARISELLASRLCHELVAPVGAVGNGIELIEEFDESMRDEAMALIATSAREASVRLQFYRMAYGFAGRQSLGALAEVRGLADARFEAVERVSLAWPPGADGGDSATALQDGGGKLLLNMIDVGVDCLPKGGVVGVEATPGTQGLALVVSAQGEGARLEPEARIALAADVAIDELSPRTVHTFFTARLAESLGGELTVEDGGDDVAIVRATLAPSG